ncbi:MAG TPA: hypothetical protein VE778_01680 [Candidatus Bathyarchaeia archaeon]|nr:hypothetical protein [Candidatus Bathyarchaeia archaeon]
MKATDLSGMANPLAGSMSSGREDQNLADARILAPAQGKRGWIESPLFDLSLFTLSPIAGLLVILPVLASPRGLHVFIAATYLIAIPHYLSSFSFYLGDENLAYYRTRRIAFFVGPVLILIGVMALRLTKMDAAVQSALYVWNVFHVSMQSAGILALYRRLHGGSPSESRFARAALLGVNGTLAFLHIDRFPPIYQNLLRIHFPVLAIPAAFLCVAVFGLVFYLDKLRRRAKPIRAPELTFLVSSLLLFYPYLWVRDLNLATFGMLMGHFLQYLGIVCLLNRRKYSAMEGSEHQKLLSSISTKTPLLLLALVSAGLVFFVAQKSSALLGVPMSYVILWNSLALIHFYLDGLVWAFKNPFVRKSIGPYLTPESHFAA